MKTENELRMEAEAAYIENLKDYLRPILKAYNHYIEASTFGENEMSEEWMIESNVNNFLETYKNIT